MMSKVVHIARVTWGRACRSRQEIIQS